MEAISALCSAKASVSSAKHHSALRTVKAPKLKLEEDELLDKKPLSVATAPVSVHASEIIPAE